MYKNNVTVIPYIPTTQNAISHPWKPETGMETVYFHTAISMTTTATAYRSRHRVMWRITCMMNATA